YKSGEDMFQALRKVSQKNHISFHGQYTMPTDPLLSDRERVKMTANEQMYGFCKEYDLHELWAYLWENWYRPLRWRLWARSTVAEITILKTTMICESHWRRIKHDFLHHFHKPRLDLLVWILVTKLAPTYYRKLDIMKKDTGRYRELPSWRKAFKKEWKRCAKTSITLPLNLKYRPDVHRWVCTCPYLAKSRFLLCKHLVQGVEPVPPIFFLQVKRSRIAPVWSHPLLKLLHSQNTDELERLNEEPVVDRIDNIEKSEGEESDDEEEENDDVALNIGSTFKEQMEDLTRDLHSFADGLAYQIQFRDNRMLSAVLRHGGSFLRMMEACLEKEKRHNMNRGAPLATWDSGSASAMYYRTRPRRGEEGT
ncbi:hypothetical protein GGU10DRAFT_275997, partial [Lentinula aff. detonsa]